MNCACQAVHATIPWGLPGQCRPQVITPIRFPGTYLPSGYSEGDAIPMNTPALNFLLATQNGDGQWGYAPGHGSAVEATAAVVLALTDSGEAEEARNRALAWLISAQNRDGGWGLNREDRRSGWQTAWAVLALSSSDDGGREAAALGADWLLGVDVFQPDDDMEQDMRELLGIEPTLRGWPWRPGEASFVEPTALAMLALEAFPDRQGVVARLEEATKYLLDRRCRPGGWNVGNPTMFGQMLPPRAEPTAWTLLALARFKPEAISAGDREALRIQMDLDGGTQALGWGILALQSLGESGEQAFQRLVARQRRDGSWEGNPYHTAVALLAARREALF